MSKLFSVRGVSESGMFERRRPVNAVNGNVAASGGAVLEDACEDDGNAREEDGNAREDVVALLASIFQVALSFVSSFALFFSSAASRLSLNFFGCS